MPPPILLFNSSTGSDTLASGAGPATALTGTNASSSVDGLTITLDGSPDLSGVATDGSHVIFFGDGTASSRNFSAITAVDNSAKTVTVGIAFNGSKTGVLWAIGGKRATLGGTTSRKITNGNGTSGDWAAGWTLRLESGYTETLTSTISTRRHGTTADGPMTIEAEPEASVMPVLTWNVNQAGFTVIGNYLHIKGLKLLNTHATKGNSAISCGNATISHVFDSNVIGESGSGWSSGIGFNSNNHGAVTVTNNNIGYNTVGVSFSSTNFIAGNTIHNCSSHGVSHSAGSFLMCCNNLIYNIGGDGIRTSTFMAGAFIVGNTLDNITGIGINYLDVTSTTQEYLAIVNNCLSNVTGARISWLITGTAAKAVGMTCLNNNFHNCGAADPADLPMEDSYSVDPQYVSATDFTPQNATVKSAGFPDTLGAATNHIGIGAIQPASGGSSGAARMVNIRGGADQ